MLVVFKPDLELDLFSTDAMSMSGLTPGKIYNAIQIIRGIKTNGGIIENIELLNDFGEQIDLESKWFIPLDKVRSEKIDSILNDGEE